MKSSLFYIFTKRLFDFCASLLGLLVLSPVFILIALAIKFDSSGPVFYLQTRVGLRGRPFKIWKFRTMGLNADQVGPLITTMNDSRITRVGQILRRYKVDELPQLINVIIGNMSLVGPRPEVQKYVNFYTEAQKAILNYKPGITDPASIRFRNESDLLQSATDIDSIYIQKILPHKIELNLKYLNNSSFFSDLKCILETIRVLILRYE